MIKILSKKKNFYNVYKIINKNKNSNIFLTGGSSTSHLYEYLNKKKFFFSKNNFFLTDERIVDYQNISKTNSFSILKDQKLKIKNFQDLYFDGKFKPQKFINRISKKNFKIHYLFLSFGFDGHIASIFKLDKKNKQNYRFTKSKLHEYERITISEKLISRSENTFLIFKDKKRFNLYKQMVKKPNDFPISILKNHYLILLF